MCVCVYNCLILNTFMSIPVLTQSQRDDFEIKLKESMENSELLRRELMELKKKSEQLLQKSELTEHDLKEVKVKKQVRLHVHASVAACTYKCGCMYMQVWLHVHASVAACTCKCGCMYMQVRLHVHTSVAACTYKCGCMYIQVEGVVGLVVCAWDLVYELEQQNLYELILCGQ